MLAGERILITGAASGIGAAAAQVFAGYGATLLLVDCNAFDAAGQATALLDVRDQAALRGAVAEFGGVTGAFLNAGIEGQGGPMMPIVDYPDDEFDRVQSVNVKGIWNGIKAVGPGMISAGRGAIVTTSSVMGWLGAPGQAAYIASKHAVAGLTRAAAIELAPHGVRVNAVLPGAIATPMLIERGFAQNPGFEDFAAALHPLGRIGQPGEVAEAAAWLLSDRASFVTGHLLAVDGGFSAR